jgi:hypothetical protein
LTRRGDPYRIYQAQRAGVLRRLVDGERVPVTKAERWLEEWEREAEAAGRDRREPRYWDDAWDWIAERR